MKIKNQLWLCVFSIILVLISNPTMAHEPTILSGEFRWANYLTIKETHLWELGEWSTQDGQSRKKELTSQGYNCYRKNQKQFSCHLVVDGKDEDLTEAIKTKVDKFLRNYKIKFEGPFNTPKEMIKTSTEQEWWVEGVVKVNNAKVQGYKWTYQFEPHSDLVVLPVNDEQPIPWFVFENNQTLRLPLQIEDKINKNSRKLLLLEARFALFFEDLN